MLAFEKHSLGTPHPKPGINGCQILLVNGLVPRWRDTDMPQSKYGQIIAQGHDHLGGWQDVMLRDGGKTRVPMLEGAGLNDLVRLEYRWSGGGAQWVAVERLNPGVQKSAAPEQNICRFCYSRFLANLPMCEHAECAAACEKCLVPSNLDPDVKACPDHIDALNRQMERDRRAA